MKDSDFEQFNDYFQLEYPVDVNITIGDHLDDTPEQELFEQQIPVPYKLASDMKGVEQNMLRPLRQLGDVIEPLADYLKAQSRKIDLMMSYILQSQETDGQMVPTHSFGGGGFIVDSDTSLPEDHYLTCKLFFTEDSSAIYCLGRIIKTDIVDDSRKRYSILFHRIRDEDREIVVRASLHQQSKMLLKKTQLKESEKS